jgi:chemotaxis protein CheD
MTKPIFVEMAELEVSNDPVGVLLTLGLGSCIGLCMYDPDARIGGVAHIALPDSALLRDTDPPAKFADIGTGELAKRLVSAGADQSRLIAAMVGGAQLFPPSDDEPYPLDIGAMNARAVEMALDSLAIPLVARDTGGATARSLELHLSQGRVVVRSVGFPERELCVLRAPTTKAQAA